MYALRQAEEGEEDIRQKRTRRAINRLERAKERKSYRK